MCPAANCRKVMSSIHVVASNHKEMEEIFLHLKIKTLASFTISYKSSYR